MAAFLPKGSLVVLEIQGHNFAGVCIQQREIQHLLAEFVSCLLYGKYLGYLDMADIKHLHYLR